MRIHNFFIQETIGDEKEVVLNDVELFHQLRNVFRMNVASRVILLDNTGFEYVSAVTSFARGTLTFRILEKRKNINIPKKEITLFQSIIKKSNFEWVLEKGTELGVSHFVPLLSERSEKKKINSERAKKILKESSEQSGRGILPTIAESVSLPEAISSLPSPSSALVFDPSGSLFQSNTLHLTPYTLFIGPEGGWSEKELALFREKNIPVYSLGPQILRSETATIAVLSLLLL
ncbi:MAG: RsmE family RNA methyltransferase [Candidatus Taylorbacteria bacterium]